MALIAISRKGQPKSQNSLTVDLPTVDPTSFGLTERAAQHILTLILTNSQNGTILRIGVQGGGCSGFSYHYQLVADSNENDVVVSAHGATVCINKKAMRLLAGSVLDWQEYMKKSGFRVINPQAKTSCSCGESFSV